MDTDNTPTLDYDILSCDPPEAIMVEFTSACNLRCRMCPLAAKKTVSSVRPGHMDQDLWKSICASLTGIDRLVIAGFGEPLLHPRFDRHIRILDRTGRPYSLITNGHRLSPKTAEQLAKLKNLTHVNVSIDSPDPAIYKEIRGSDLAAPLSGVRNLVAAFGEGRRVSVSSVVTDTNIKSLVKFPALLGEMKVWTYIIQGLTDYPAQSEVASAYRTQELSECIDRLRAECKSHDVTLSLHIPSPDWLKANYRHGEQSTPSGRDHESVLTSRDCFQPWEFSFINKDGRVFPCCFAASDPSAELGNLREEDFPTIWNNERYRQFREGLLRPENMHDSCRKCTAAPVVPVHRLVGFSAVLLPELFEFHDSTSMRVAVRNVGTREWNNQETMVSLATASPRDRNSRLHLPTWSGISRVAALTEPVVRPGEVATFNFEVNDRERQLPEEFQVVVEGGLWLPNTKFEVPGREGDARRQPGNRLLELVLPNKYKYSAEIVENIFDSEHHVCTLRARNTGRITWTHSTPLRVGTTAPRDRISPIYHPSWYTKNRVVTFRERSVRPGQTATFAFLVTPPAAASREAFQLVLEGKCWLDHTTFYLDFEGAGG